MANKILIKRGLSANRASIVPGQGEAIWCTDTKILYIGDGTTAGGISVLTSLGTASSKNTGTTDGTIPLIGSGNLLPKAILPTYKGGYFEVATLSGLTALSQSEQNCLVKVLDTQKYYTLNGVYTSLGSWLQVNITARDLAGVTRNGNGDLLLDANTEYTIA
jgi:hypothetical protein